MLHYKPLLFITAVLLYVMAVRAEFVPPDGSTCQQAYLTLNTPLGWYGKFAKEPLGDNANDIKTRLDYFFENQYEYIEATLR